jgi:hypothetical protein
MFSLKYEKHIATTTTDTAIVNHAIKGNSKLLDPHAVVLLLVSLLSSGHPNILPSRTSIDALDVRRAGGAAPDSRLTVKSSDDNGG